MSLALLPLTQFRVLGCHCMRYYMSLVLLSDYLASLRENIAWSHMCISQHKKGSLPLSHSLSLSLSFPEPPLFFLFFSFSSILGGGEDKLKMIIMFQHWVGMGRVLTPGTLQWSSKFIIHVMYVHIPLLKISTNTLLIKMPKVAYYINYLIKRPRHILLCKNNDDELCDN